MNTVTDQRLLYVLCDGGLANRMNAIAGAKVVADRTGRQLRIWWPMNDCLAASFETLFEPLAPEIARIATTADMLEVFDTSARTKFYNCGTVYGKDNENTTSEEWLNVAAQDEHEIVCIKCWYRPQLAGAKHEHTKAMLNLRSMFRYSDELRRVMGWMSAGIRSFAEENVGPLVGVHIRHGDPVAPGSSEWDQRTLANYKGSTMPDFVDAINTVLTINPKSRFVVTSHNHSLTLDLGLRFPECVYGLPPTCGRHTETGMLQDAAHLFLLGMHSEFVIGSYWSQFSSVAAECHCLPLVIAGTEHMVDKIKELLK